MGRNGTHKCRKDKTRYQGKGLHIRREENKMSEQISRTKSQCSLIQQASRLEFVLMDKLIFKSRWTNNFYVSTLHDDDDTIRIPSRCLI